MWQKEEGRNIIVFVVAGSAFVVADFGVSVQTIKRMTCATLTGNMYGNVASCCSCPTLAFLSPSGDLGIGLV